MAKDTRTAVVVVGVSLSQKGGETWRYTAADKGPLRYVAGPVSGRPGSAFPLLVCGPSAPALANRLRQRAFPGRRLRSDHVLPECGLY